MTAHYPGPPHMTQRKLAARWRVSIRTLDRWRALDRGPAWLRLGGRVVYRCEDVPGKLESDNLKADVTKARLYQPTANRTYPGSSLPHAWLDDEDGRRLAIKDLVRPGRFLLIAAEEGQDWCAAAARITEANDLPVDAVRIGHLDDDWFDPRLAWAQFRGISEKGAVLVRPDRVVCWRHAETSRNPLPVLGDALGTMLGRKLRREAVRRPDLASSF